MSKVEKYSNSIKIVKSSEENSQKPKIITTKTIEVVSRRGNSRDKENKNTGQFQYKKETNPLCFLLNTAISFQCIHSSKT